uniref:Uncharacterized protein n=1 Tax=Arundo donax TaxID=35708 RepID=A0A0A9HRK1_ARUDO
MPPVQACELFCFLDCPKDYSCSMIGNFLDMKLISALSLFPTIYCICNSF